MASMTPEQTAALDAWLLTAEHCDRVDLLTVTTRTGITTRWNSSDIALTLPDGRTFSPFSFERGRLRLSADLETDEMGLTLHVGDGDTFAGVPMLHFARRGGLDGATIQLERAFYDGADTLKGWELRFEGKSGPADTGLGLIELSARSLISQLSRLVPAEVYQPGCRNTVYDGRCSANPAAFAATGAVTQVPVGSLSHFVSDLAQAGGYFDLGAVEFTTGALAGEARSVKSYQGGAVQTVLPWPTSPAVGDLVRIRPGCDGTKATCITRFNNLANYRGEPHIPAPETVA